MARKIQKEKNLLNYRLPIWQRELLSPDGTTVREMAAICESLLGESDPEAVLRQDLHQIRELLRGTEVHLIDDGKARNKTYRLDGAVDLTRLRHEKAYGSEKEALMQMLQQMQGVLPEGVLEKVTSNIGRMYREKQEQNLPIVVAYESNIGMKYEMEFFYPMLSAIQKKQGLRIIRHALRQEQNKEEILFYPEFLRQYKTLWHAFGVATDTDGIRIGEVCERVQLHLIDELSVLPADKYPFVASGITDYLDEYFSEIIGVDNVSTQEVLDITLAVKNNMAERMLNNPLHESMSPIKSKACVMPGYKLFALHVKRNKELMRRLLEMGQDVVVLEPEKLRKEIRRELQKALSRY